MAVLLPSHAQESGGAQAGANAAMYPFSAASIGGTLRLGTVNVALSPTLGLLESATASLTLHGSLGHLAPGWEVRRQLAVTITYDVEYFLAADDVFDVYGTGDTPSEALQDYVVSLIELYEMVERDVRQNVPHTQSELDHLSSYLRHQ